MINAQQILAELPIFARDSQWAGESSPTPALHGPELGFLKGHTHGVMPIKG